MYLWSSRAFVCLWAKDLFLMCRSGQCDLELGLGGGSLGAELSTSGARCTQVLACGENLQSGLLSCSPWPSLPVGRCFPHEPVGS